MTWHIMCERVDGALLAGGASCSDSPSSDRFLLSAASILIGQRQQKSFFSSEEVAKKFTLELGGFSGQGRGLFFWEFFPVVTTGARQP